MANEIIKVYYPDNFNMQQFAYCETRGSFNAFVENINSFVGRLDMDPYAFEESSQLQRYRMYWVDEDGDKVSINSDNSLRIFLNKTNGVKKVYVVDKDTPAEQPQKESQASTSTAQTATDPSKNMTKHIHQGVECDNCNVCPIVGFRYKCAQCDDYDLCSNCEQNQVHADHVMYRFPVPLPRQAEFNRRFFKKMRHGCFGRPTEHHESERPRKCSRRTGGSGSGPHERYQSASGAFTNFYTMMCDLAEGMDQQDIEQAQGSGSANNAAQKEKSSPTNADRPPQTSKESQQSPNISNSTEEVPILPAIDPVYARAGVQVLRNFSQMFGKLLDPLGITVDVDIGLKDDKEKETVTEAATGTDDQATAPPAEKPTTDNASGTETPIPVVNLVSPSPSQASVAESIQSHQSASNDGIRVFGNDTAAPAQNLQQDKPMDIDADANVVTVPEPGPSTSTESNGATRKRGSSPIEASWTLVDKQFDELQINPQKPEKQPEVIATGAAAVEKQPESTDSNVSATAAAATAAATDINYAKLSQDLRTHMQAEQQKAKPLNPRSPSSAVYHSDKKINDAVVAMMAMGFSNEGGWLINLLENCKGDISKALDMLHPTR